MNEQKIEASKITKPIQLLASWLAGLILVNGSFLATAISITTPEWVRASLVVASIVNVPLFLIFLFMLQTKFRPEMQEDAFYAKYLELNTGKLISTNPIEAVISELRNDIAILQLHHHEKITSFDSDLKALTQKLSERSHGSLAEVDNVELKEVLENIDLKFKSLDTNTEKLAFVQINDLVPEYHEIRSELRKLKIKISKTFGSSSSIPETPKHKIISFGDDVPIAQLKQVVLLCQKFGFDQINYSERDFNKRNIYIGSYIYKASDEKQAVLISPEILKILNSTDSDVSDLIDEIEGLKK